MSMEYDGFPHEDTDRVLVITRHYPVPPERIWQAWTDPTLARHWMVPQGFTNIHLKNELRPDGAWRLGMRNDTDGVEYWQGGVYIELVKPERLVWIFAWDEADGRRSHETRVTLNLASRADGTSLDFRQETFDSMAERDSHRDDWNSVFDRLAGFLDSGTG